MVSSFSLIGRSRSLKEEADRRNILPEELIKKLKDCGYEAVDRDIFEDEDEEEDEDESASYEKSLEEERVAMAQKQAALVASEPGRQIRSCAP